MSDIESGVTWRQREGRLPRLFTGIEVPREVALALSLKRGGLFGARWIDSENYHITLRFIGDVDYHVANEVTAMLDRLADSEAFTIRLDHIGSFGGNSPRALFAGCTSNAALLRLQAAQERVLQRCGLAPREPPLRTACRPRAFARRFGTGGRSVHRDGRAVHTARVPGFPLRAVFIQGLGGRRALSRRTGLSPGGVTR
jgi:hypothetical protein